MSEGAESSPSDVTFSDDDQALIEGGGEDIATFLAGGADREGLVLDLLDRRLDGDIDQGTWSLVWGSLSTLVSTRAMSLIAWAATGEPTLLDSFAPHIPPVTALLLRRITATHGAEMRTAFMRSSELPNNWRTIAPEVYQDLVKNQFEVRIRIEKYNGERVLIEAPGNSILGLVTNMLSALRLAGSRQAFTEANIAEYLVESDGLLKILRPAPEPASPPAPVADSDIAPVADSGIGPVAEAATHTDSPAA